MSDGTNPAASRSMYGPGWTDPDKVRERATAQTATVRAPQGWSTNRVFDPMERVCQTILHAFLCAANLIEPVSPGRRALGWPCGVVRVSFGLFGG